MLALDKVDFELKHGEVMALIGQNGAGKTTLIKILGGAIPPDSGKIYLEGKKIVLHSPKDAYRLGFSFIFQEGGLIDYLSGLENIFIGMPYPKKWIKIDWKRLKKEGKTLKAHFEINVDLKRPVYELSPLDRKKVEILKALARDPKLFVLDEPTQTLTQKETRHLFSIIRDLKKRNIGIIYISHFLDEVFEIADRVTVLRDGKNVGVFSVGEITKEKLISYQLGEKGRLKEKMTLPEHKKEKVLDVSHLYTDTGLEDISFSLYKGEILGIFAPGGQGKTRLAMALSGNARITKGEVTKNSKKLRLSSPKDALSHGIFLIPQDRSLYGVIESFSVRENLSLPVLSTIKKGIFVLDMKKEKEKTKEIVEELDIKAKGTEVLLSTLSGGNKQKVVIGKGLLKNADLFIFDEPTQGLDILSKEEVYAHLIEFSKKGISQIVISSDIDELFRITHRIMIMKKGKIQGIFCTKETTPEDIISFAYGGSYEYN